MIIVEFDLGFEFDPWFGLFRGGGVSLLDQILPKVLNLACCWKSPSIVLGLVVGIDIFDRRMIFK